MNNIQLEKELVALKAEVAALKSSNADSVKAELDELKRNLQKLFSNLRDPYDLGRNWDNLTYVAPTFEQPVVEETKKPSTRELIDAALIAAREFGVKD
jgi:hypothetical protein